MADAPSVKAPNENADEKKIDSLEADGQLAKSEAGTYSSGARHSADGYESETTGNSGDNVSPAREDTPKDAPGQPDGEILHVPGEPYTAGNPVARAVIYDARDDFPVGDEGTNAEEAAKDDKGK